MVAEQSWLCATGLANHVVKWYGRQAEANSLRLRSNGPSEYLHAQGSGIGINPCLRIHTEKTKILSNQSNLRSDKQKTNGSR